MNFEDRINNELACLPVFSRMTEKPSPSTKPTNHNLPFQENKENLFSIKSSLPIYSSECDDGLLALLVYEITPNSWNFIYCHTEKLDGYATLELDNGKEEKMFDFYDPPYEIIKNGLETYVDAILKECDRHLHKMHKDDPALPELYKTMLDIDRSKSTDFICDIYIPPAVCDLTGHRYIRPSDQYAQTFANSSRTDIDFTPPQALIEYLRDTVIEDLPKNGLKTMYDKHIEVVKQFGGAYKEDATTTHELPAKVQSKIDPREPRTYSRRRTNDWIRRCAFRL